ncbi:MAG: methyltransferase domain-containing protein [Aquabacterium sp.]|nr:methyltransferase domain-containing protein [Aquabacterium sp.]
MTAPWRRLLAGAWLLAAAAAVQGQAQPQPLPPPPALAASDEEVPFITTPDRVTLAMLQLAGVGPGDVLIDLGSGDGRIVITAALRFGARGLGVDIVPDLVARSQASAARAGVASRASFRVQDLFDTPLAGASVITLYLLPEFNLRLRPRLLALPAGTRIVSHDWDMGDWPPDRTLTLAVPEKAIGLDKRSRLHLWVVPAQLQGLWCGPGGLALQVQQHYQAVQATLMHGAEQLALAGRVDGARLQLLGSGPGASWAVELGATGALRVQSAPQGAALQAGHQLQPATGASCGPGR